MAKDFQVATLSVPDNDTDRASTIETWLDGLNIPTGNTIYTISIVHLRSFYEVTIIYEP